MLVVEAELCCVYYVRGGGNMCEGARGEFAHAWGIHTSLAVRVQRFRCTEKSGCSGVD